MLLSLVRRLWNHWSTLCKSGLHPPLSVCLYFVVNRIPPRFYICRWTSAQPAVSSSSCLLCLCHAAVAFAPLLGEHTRTAASRAILSSLRLTDSRQNTLSVFSLSFSNRIPAPLPSHNQFWHQFLKGCGGWEPLVEKKHTDHLIIITQ